MNTDERKMSALEKMRARLFAQDPTLANLALKPRRDSSIFPHWEMAVGVSATLRFLPDGNEDNTFFWVQRDMIKLPFHGIKGKPEIKQFVVQVPCMEMYDEDAAQASKFEPEWVNDRCEIHSLSQLLDLK